MEPVSQMFAHCPHFFSFIVLFNISKSTSVLSTLKHEENVTLKRVDMVIYPKGCLFANTFIGSKPLSYLFQYRARFPKGPISANPGLK